METATHINDIKDNYFRTILMNNINLYKNDYLDIHTYADLPASTGLGSSSTFIIGMLNALYSLKGIYKSPKDLANEAIKVERVDLKEKEVGRIKYLRQLEGLIVFTLIVMIS